MFLAPPWQHYDEPGNFEYAWLAANYATWPKLGDYDQGMRREVAASMIEHDFYRGIDGIPNLLSYEPIPIGISQLEDVPVYYFLASLPLRVFRYSDITFQLYLVRSVSLLLFIFTIWISHKISVDLFGKEHPLAWMVPLFLACLPSFVDLMTAANNDAGAIAFFTLFLWSSVRAILRGPGPWRIGALLITSALCLFTKSTAWIAAPLLPLAIFLALVKHSRFRTALLWTGAFVIIFGLFALFDLDQSAPAYYYSRSNDALLFSEPSTDAPLGRYIFSHEKIENRTGLFYHLLAPDDVRELAGQPVTFGVWIWADQPTELTFPYLQFDKGRTQFQGRINLTSEPVFYAFQKTLPKNISSGWLAIATGPVNEINKIHWDGFVLVIGHRPTDQQPVFHDAKGTGGNWGGVEFSNAIRNGSGEIHWPLIATPVSDLISSHINIPPNYVWAMLDLEATGWYFTTSLAHIFRTFWAYFGWAHVPLLGSRPYRVFLVLTFMSLIGIIKGAIQHRKALPWDIILYFSTVVGLELFIVLMRGSGSWFSRTLIPAARYFYPAILPVAIVLNWGWYQMGGRLTQPLKIPPKISASLYVFVCIVISIWAMISIYKFYQ